MPLSAPVLTCLYVCSDGSDTTSHTNTFELYGPTKADTALYPVAASDDTRSYGTYDKSMDDFSDEYNRDYEVGCLRQALFGVVLGFFWGGGLGAVSYTHLRAHET